MEFGQRFADTVTNCLAGMIAPVLAASAEKSALNSQLRAKPPLAQLNILMQYYFEGTHPIQARDVVAASLLLQQKDWAAEGDQDIVGARLVKLLTPSEGNEERRSDIFDQFTIWTADEVRAAKNTADQLILQQTTRTLDLRLFDYFNHQTQH